jgi:hypothetical protein
MTALTLRTGLALPAALSVRRGLSPQPGGGGPPPYHADAVHFDGGTSLHTASLAAVDAATLTFNLFYKIPAPTSGAPTFFVSDPANQYVTAFQTGGSADTLVHYYGDVGTGGVLASTHFGSVDDVWVSITGGVNIAAGFIAAYLNDASRGQPPIPTGSGSVITLNGVSFYFGDDSFGTSLTGDVANFRLWAGVSILDGSGSISEANRRLLVDANGKPVAPAVANASLGTPTISFIGDASTFATNQGTGGAFTTTGTLTNASTSPSD